MTQTTITTVKAVARIHQAPTGRWYITDDSLNYLDECGSGYKSEREAIKAARASGFTHRVNSRGNVVKL